VPVSHPDNHVPGLFIVVFLLLVFIAASRLADRLFVTAGRYSASIVRP
jgi:hypothetical protein